MVGDKRTATNITEDNDDNAVSFSGDGEILFCLSLPI